MIWTDKEKCRAIDIIEELREEEGSSVNIACDNPDFNSQPDCFIEVIGSWTGWTLVKFTGKCLLDCLEKTLKIKKDGFNPGDLPEDSICRICAYRQDGDKQYSPTMDWLCKDDKRPTEANTCGMFKRR